MRRRSRFGGGLRRCKAWYHKIDSAECILPPPPPSLLLPELVTVDEEEPVTDCVLEEVLVAVDAEEAENDAAGPVGGKQHGTLVV